MAQIKTSIELIKGLVYRCVFMTVCYKSFFKKHIIMQIPYLHSSEITRVDKTVCYLNGFQ